MLLDRRKGHNDSCSHLSEEGIVSALKREIAKRLDELMPTDPDALGWMKHKLESRLLGEISTTSDMQRHHPYGRK